MKFIFNKNLDYQLDAIKSAVNLFDTGKNIIKLDHVFRLQSSTGIIPNNLEIDKGRIWKNLQSIQRTNNINISFNETGLTYDDPAFITNASQLNMDFSVEMETGTGKTYVYLRTILELNQKYDVKKFIILVPSVAIREGVLKTLEQTKEHFRDLYNTNFGYFAYDSNNLNKVRDFAQSNDIQIMIMTVQSFAGNERLIMRQTPDRFHGERPIDLIAQTNPIVIMDEPQNMESALAKEAIKDLNPLFKLRYSATHKEIHNLVYKLTPVDAYRKGLVKKISVYGVKENDAGAFLFKVKNIQTKKGENPKAKVLLEVKKADGTYSYEETVVTNGDDIYRKSKKNEKYDGLTVQDINANHNRIELSNGEYYTVDESENNKEAIFRTQIKETIKCHFDKQKEIGTNLKVLSLFFVDKVDNYIHNDSLVRKIFTEEFNKLKKNYRQFKDVNPDLVHKGYFASRKVKGREEFIDTKGDSKADKEAYDLIMKNKEDLLSLNQPVSFIFSHSALREGWDNPNVFQICTLRETQSVMTKRQEIGRGLRLPVDVNGSRVYDQNIAVLTVIANSSYEEYASGLQQEFEDAGYMAAARPDNAREKKVMVKTTKHVGSEDFKELWKRISKKTAFSIDILTEQLIKNSVIEINQLNTKSITVTIEKGEIYFDKDGNMDGTRDTTAVGYKIEREIIIPNIVDRVSKETGLTRKTIFEILSQVENLDLVFNNPEEYVRSVILIVKNQLHNHLINSGLKYTKTGEVYNMESLFKDFESLSNKVISSAKSVFDHIVCDGLGEKEFAESLEHSSKVKVYAKLPRGFYVDTPIGKYNPDWAIVWKGENSPDKFYLVRETKFGYEDLARDLSWEELGKIKCARKHFEEIGVDFEVVQDENLLDLLK